MVYNAKPLYLLKPAHNTIPLQESIDSFQELWLEKHDYEDKKTLFHYTDLNGLRGILENRAIWCGHVSSLNDPAELHYGRELIKKILNEYISKQESEEIRHFINAMIVQVEAFGQAMFHTFISCFCESNNLLSQWRSYAANGGGYSIGFEFSNKTKISSDISNLGNISPLFLRKIIYNQSDQQDLISSYLDKAIDAVNRAIAKGIGEQYNDMPNYVPSVMAMQATNVLLDMIISFKNPVFESEQEWRLVRVAMENHQPDKLNFRENNNELIPYRQVYIFSQQDDNSIFFPLNSIRFGPALEPVRTKAAIELFLYKLSVDNHQIKILPSSVNISSSGYSIR